MTTTLVWTPWQASLLLFAGLLLCGIVLPLLGLGIEVLWKRLRHSESRSAPSGSTPRRAPAAAAPGQVS